MGVGDVGDAGVGGWGDGGLTVLGATGRAVDEAVGVGTISLAMDRDEEGGGSVGLKVDVATGGGIPVVLFAEEEEEKEEEEEEEKEEAALLEAKVVAVSLGKTLMECVTFDTTEPPLVVPLAALLLLGSTLLATLLLMLPTLCSLWTLAVSLSYSSSLPLRLLRLLLPPPPPPPPPPLLVELLVEPDGCTCILVMAACPCAVILDKG